MQVLVERVAARDRSTSSARSADRVAVARSSGASGAGEARRGRNHSPRGCVKDRTLLSMASGRPSAWAGLAAALSSRRIAAVTLQSFSSGLPLGLVWIALPALLTYRGVDIRTVGLFSLAQAPWTFKFLWSPLMDRFGPRFPRMGRRRSWILVCQLVLAATILVLAGVGTIGGRHGHRPAGARHRVRLGVAGHRDRRVRRGGARAFGAGARRGRAHGAGEDGGPALGGRDDHLRPAARVAAGARLRRAALRASRRRGSLVAGADGAPAAAAGRCARRYSARCSTSSGARGFSRSSASSSSTSSARTWRRR